MSTVNEVDPKIIDGKRISKEIKEEIRDKVSKLNREGKEVALAVILVGENPASQVYVRNKQKACEFTGIKSLSYNLPEDTSEEELLDLIEELNHRDDVNGILVQLPLPKQINEERILDRIDPKKDVDGFHPVSVGNLSIGRPGYVSCTPAGIIELLKRSDIPMDGKNVVIVGRSNIVGKPMAILMLRENATVTICHSHTKNMREITSQADILVAAIGKPKFFKKEDVKEGAVVIDVGMDRDENNKLCGDVDFDDVYDKVSHITPVPGGVGPMTIAMLMSNVLHSLEI
ncbi:MAG: bifunctional methylenetetrahydrofolate dehydrogenase/methenyltetrahydrofolate cyclohydrolase FolD [Lachnospiraceae bacterium]|nr:bifunctional methylenetetrahydrofolate dehydrogenase/methenyltetrahydrofolate cyclohydrolase FolD [Lachnospiraceae bacterium]MDY5705051.1 bifunctional methylenetetrahydrofolate dehydrogenase/methenyltetrahydrofolate cyclohydrolase FolD [Lachnospiraceae bacterium]